jgi:phage anti-repressor protein
MELQILISKKGTKVVTASNLYGALELPEHHYSATLLKWIDDFYEFSDGIRKPIRLQDFAKRKISNNPILKDYYISLELAKKITLRSKSKLKRKFSKKLKALQDQEAQEEVLSQEQIQTVLEIAKTMTRLSCQESAERKHQEIYTTRNGGSSANWWKYRSHLLGYSADYLRKQMEKNDKKYKGKSQRQMLLQLNQKAELIRTAVIDLFMIMGKTETQAKKLGDLAKFFAEEMKLDIYDDRESGNLFASSINTDMLSALKNYRHATAL